MTSTLIDRAEQHDYQKLFIQDLNWSKPDHAPLVIDYDGHAVEATNVSSYKGLRVWVVEEKPNSKLEAIIDQQLAKTSTDRIVIFHDGDEQVWRWPVRRTNGNTTATRLSRHRHRRGDTDPRFAMKLDVIRLPIDVTLDANAVLARVRSAFDVEAQNETRHASKLMARLYAAMEAAYTATADPKVRDHEISVTLARILFLMFGDDTDMWPEGLFQHFILDRTAADGSDIDAKLTELFAYLDTPPKERGNAKPEFDGFRYVNGGIFNERLTLPPINAEFRAAVLDACDRDWKTISPAIFGSMFQSVRDAQTRRELGEHYTSEENILKTLNPLFLDELRAEFEHIKTLGKYEAGRLRKFRDKLGRIRYMDPACGCGNFIIVAYRELRDLELAIMERLQEITGDPAMLLANYGLKVTLDHFYGIEIDEWPARIAETAMFLIDRQCDLKLTASLGWAPDRLPIQEQATIVVSNALRTDWKQILPPTVDTIVAGNPPFLGHISRSAAQSEELRSLWGRDDIGRLDYATGWYAKALRYFSQINGRWAFVSTNSVAQGEPVATLFQEVFSGGWRIRFAHRTFAWESEGVGAATVHCVILGFDRDSTAPPRLFDYQPGASAALEIPVKTINAYLVDGPNVLVEPSRRRLSGQLSTVSFGSRPNDGGNFIIEPDEYEEVVADPIAKKYVRRFVGSRELLNNGNRWCLWLVDLQESDLEQSPLLRDRVEGCRQHRLGSKRPATREWAQWPHLFDFNSQPDQPYLCIPGVASERRAYFTAKRFGPHVIASNAVFTTADPDGFQFAIISSSMFITWQRTVGGRLKSDLRFSNTVVWNSLPLPGIDNHHVLKIIEAGKAIEDVRHEFPDLSLARLYGPEMPGVLLAAHKQLDVVVDAAFGASGPCRSEQERQRRLFQRFVELS